MSDEEKPEVPAEGAGDETAKPGPGLGGLGIGEDGDKNMICNPEIAFLFDPNRDQFPAKPYNEDGNPDFYSEDNMKKRGELEKDPVV